MAVCDLDPEKQRQFAQLYHVPEENCFSSYEDLLSKGKIADALMICTSDKLHFKPAMRAIELGYHILLEKPMSVDPTECVCVSQSSREV